MIFEFIEKTFLAGLTILLSVNPLNTTQLSAMSRTYETRHIKWHETCKCKCRLDASVCNNKQR